MADSARGRHVSPGIYTRETSLNYAVKSLGITTLGLVGETVKGPAFQPMEIKDWREFQDVFGGTNATKFRDTQYPKYELPYIAKSYLTESNQLNVVRVLGLCGYNAGPAWVITAEGDGGGSKQAVAVLRSRAHYVYHKSEPENASEQQTKDYCDCRHAYYDYLQFEVGETSEIIPGNCFSQKYNDAVAIREYNPLGDSSSCDGYAMSADTADGFPISPNNLGRFKIVGVRGAQAYSENFDVDSFTGDSGYFSYSVSLNPTDKEYILNVFGSDPQKGDAPLYVEALYDVALEQGIQAAELTKISSDLTFYHPYRTADFCGMKPINDILTISHTALTRKMVGKRFLANEVAVDAGIKCVKYDYTSNKPSEGEVKEDNSYAASTDIKVGQIYTVKQYTDPDGARHYYYTYYDKDSITDTSIGDVQKAVIADKLGTDPIKTTLVYNMSDGLYYRLVGNEVKYVELDMNDYKSAYRYASTPWIVSNLKGDAKKAEVNRLFRFHTISDGDSSNYMVKVSIENILPDTGEFDVVVRKIDDVDEAIIPLERFGKCNMVPGTPGYIAYRIGSFDGVYESKSKYITVECKEGDIVENSVPAGFLGYPIQKYDGTPIEGEAKSGTTGVTFPTIKYNTLFDAETKNRKQYFGLSSRVGVDIDLFTFKGRKAYIEDPAFLSDGFHLDSQVTGILDGNKKETSKITVDGESGYTFQSVDQSSRTDILDAPPVISEEANMIDSIYQYVNLRKFTVYFYGGFDGWDVYRGERSIGDGFKMTQYRGYVDNTSGEGYSFDRIPNPDLLALNQNGITSDWYAYLSGIRQFANPEQVDINVFATPGIDYVNAKLLVQEAIDMIEEERADSIYVVTTPDKPKGSGDYQMEMYTPEEAVYNLEDSEIDSNYTCTYYPWVKYLDQDNNQYIYLPATKDVVRNFAQTDNQAYSWFAPAGMSRGNVDCVRAKLITKIADEDVLYEGRINPIKTFSQEGPKVWGQKNLQIEESQLNRIAVRRLLLRLRKLISISCIGLIFDQYDSTVKQKFISAVTPILDAIRSNRGISDYRIEVDDSLEARQNRELLAKIYYKPYNALEYISIDLVLTGESVEFME